MGRQDHRNRGTGHLASAPAPCLGGNSWARKSGNAQTPRSGKYEQYVAAKKAYARAARAMDRERRNRQKQRDAKTRAELAADGVEENPGPKPEGPKSGTKRRAIKCHTCGEEGHIMRCCTKGRRDGEGTSKSNVGKEPEEMVRASTSQILEKVDQVTRHNGASLIHSRHETLPLKMCFALFDGGFLDLSKDASTDALLIAAGMSMPEPVKVEAPPAPAPPVLGSFMTPAQFCAAKGLTEEHVSERVVYWRFGLVFVASLAAMILVEFMVMTMTMKLIMVRGGPRSWNTWVTGSKVLGYSGSLALGLVMTVIASVVGWVMSITDETSEPECEVTLEDVGSDGDERLRTVTHVAKLARRVRCHRYRWRDGSEVASDDPHHEIYVVDHWVAVAQSEFGEGQDPDTFLKNVHLKYLRCGELDIPATMYQALKFGTTEYLRLWLDNQGFINAAPPNWQGRAALVI